MTPRAPFADDAALTVSGLRAYYRTRAFGIDREVKAVDDVDLRIATNEIYGLAGESSCGKTTLAKVMAAAIRPPLTVVSGTVTFNVQGRRLNLYELDADALAEIRWKHLSYIMQGSMSALNPVRRIKYAFVDFAFRHIGQSKPTFWTIVRDHLQRLRLDPAILEAFPHQLSGGMRQRVTIALATVCRPAFIIADEPTTALDVVVQKDVLAMIRDVQRELRSSLVFVTHDMAVHANLCDRLGIMYGGRLIEEGITADIFRAARHPYTRHLIASLPRLGHATPQPGLDGAPPNLADPPTGCRFHPRCPLAMDVCRRDTPQMTVVAPGHRVACFAASAAP
jgi:peptide/nickel transport system ATP-binding protein